MKNYQNTLFPYAYNVLGSSADAKDAIQDVLLKYTSMDVEPENEKNYLIRGVINQSINIKRKKKKMQPAGKWLPEPISTETPDLEVEMRELISYSLLFLLEQLNPKERAVFILNEAFAYTHQEIADVLSCSVVNSRKLLSRARSKIEASNRLPGKAQKLSTDFEQIDKYTKAIQSRDTQTLQALLSDDITYYADG